MMGAIKELTNYDNDVVDYSKYNIPGVQNINKIDTL